MSTDRSAAESTAQTERDPRRWWILAVLCSSLFVIVLDNTILNVAIPSITEQLGASTAQIQWTINAYTLVLSGLLITAGGLSDRLGRKRALLLGLAVFGAGSLLGAMAGTPEVLIAARAVMGVGAAFLMPGTLAVLVRTFDDDERPRAIGIWAAVSSVGMALGPVFGGFLLDHFWWGSTFLINVPVAIVGLIAMGALLRESKDPSGARPDLLGAVLSTVSVVALVWAVISVPRDGWLDPRTLGTGLVGVVGVTIFVWWEKRTADPMLDMSMFSNPKFRGAVLGGILTAFGMAGSLFLLTQDLQFLRGYNPLEAGAQLTPMAIGVLISSILISPRVLKAFGVGKGVAIGVSGSAAGLLTVALAPDSGGYLVLMAGLLLLGMGAGVSGPLVANALMSSIPRERASTGSGVNNTLQELGSGLGVGVLGAVLVAGFSQALPDSLGEGAGQSYPQAVAAANGSDRLLADVRDSFAQALTLSQVIGAAAVLLGGWLAGMLLLRAEREQQRAAAEAEAQPPARATGGQTA
ncbi:MFS transporter [Streptomyces sp. CB02130]|uniref:MFS transporter n=1 Tax=Streptomyces sp. CB02130 TaxID=1703934 RepID=UPI00093ECB94|nr:MFS transporter [Streptomyces sp. CB02130]OKJ22013.1 MFS transporter [Streptomyces sp. CB02130]